MKDIFGASKFLAIMNETVINIHGQGFLWGAALLWGELLGGISLQLHSVNIKEHTCWILC